MTESYLAVLEAKVERATETACLISAKIRDKGGGPHDYLNSLSAPDRAWASSDLCRFDLSGFWRLSQEIVLTRRHPDYQSSFLRPAGQPHWHCGSVSGQASSGRQAERGNRHAVR
jgi:hypothetical protein